MLRKMILSFVTMLFLMLPAFSQDTAKARIAFARNKALYVLEPNGSSPILVDEAPTYDYSAVWSPDGTKLAYLASADGETNNQMRTLKVWDGTQSTELVSNFKTEMPINWTRDGKLLYVVDAGSSAQEFLSLEVYIIDPTPGAAPELVTNQASNRTGCGGGSPIPMDQASWVENGFGGQFFIQLTDYGLIYPSTCYGSISLFRTFSNEQIPFHDEAMTDVALSVDQRSLAGIITNYQEQTTSLSLINLETLEETLLQTQYSPRQVAWDADGNLYYSSTTQVGDLLDGLPDDQRSSLDASVIPLNTVSVYRLAPDGTETPVFEGLDAYEIGRMRVVGTTLYFSAISNGSEWLTALLNGTLTSQYDLNTSSYIHTTLYKVDLATPNSSPVVVVTDAAQFAVSGQ